MCRCCGLFIFAVQDLSAHTGRGEHQQNTEVNMIQSGTVSTLATDIHSVRARHGLMTKSPRIKHAYGVWHSTSSSSDTVREPLSLPREQHSQRIHQPIQHLRPTVHNLLQLLPPRRFRSFLAADNPGLVTLPFRMVDNLLATICTNPG